MQRGNVRTTRVNAGAAATSAEPSRVGNRWAPSVFNVRTSKRRSTHEPLWMSDVCAGRLEQFCCTSCTHWTAPAGCLVLQERHRSFLISVKFGTHVRYWTSLPTAGRSGISRRTTSRYYRIVAHVTSLPLLLVHIVYLFVYFWFYCTNFVVS